MPIFDRSNHHDATDPDGWTLADFNEVDELPDEYRGSHFTKAVNGLPSQIPEGTLERLLADAVKELGILTDPLTDRSDPAVIRRMADLYCFLHEAARMVSGVTAWCVVKVYDPDGTFKAGDIAVWCGCTTETQANELRDAMERIYTRKGRTSTDTWEVRLLDDVKPHNVVRPDATDRYIRRIENSVR